MCDACDAFFTPVAIDSDAVYHDALERASLAIEDELLELLESSVPLDKAGTGDLTCRKHTFTCLRCGQLFILERGGCHIIGDQWRPLHGN
jgi:hypothetical protein